MKCSDLKVVNLTINEDNYEFKASFRLCAGDVCTDVDLEQYERTEILEEIKRSFSIQESTEEMKEILMGKIMEATKLESRNEEGHACCKDIEDKEVRRKIDELSIS